MYHDTRNMKEDFLYLTKIAERNGILVKCADMEISIWGVGKNPQNQLLHFYLPVNYTSDELDKFLDNINIEYDDGTDAIIWFDDGSWASIIENDGHEWWYIHKFPNIPSHVAQNDGY